MSMAPEMNWGFSASTKADDLEKRVDRLEKAMIQIQDSVITLNSIVHKLNAKLLSQP